MKTFLTIGLLLLCAGSALAQQALVNKPPQAFGPVKTIVDQWNSVTFSRDKTRIEKRVPNGSTIVWLFTIQGRLLTFEIFERDGRVSGTKSIYNYESGRLASIFDYVSGELFCTQTFTYPEVFRVKITRVCEQRKDSDIEIDEYDQAGNITKATFPDRVGGHTELYKYDSKGNPTEFVVLDVWGKRQVEETYRYEFDSYGNWTKQVKDTLADPRSAIQRKTTVARTITYY